MVVIGSRNQFAQHLDGATCVELGVADGKFSAYLLKHSRAAVVYSIDSWCSLGHNEAEMLIAAERLREFGDRSCIIRASFEDAAKTFADEHFDFVYVDGYARSGQNKGKTLEQWYPKVKRGGIFAGHDYHQKWRQTVEQVDRFAARLGVSFQVTTGDRYPSWYFRKP